MNKRPPNELESKLHKAILATPKKEMMAKDLEAIIPDPNAREKALNFLLAVGLLKTLVDSNRKVSFRAVTKGELVVTKDLNGEENLVFNHIKAAGNEGIWIKHLKTKTNLHQTIIDRCLKTLTKKHLVKRVPSVQYPTRKIYMLEGLEPSISLTGGPWYTDNELDTEFIQKLTEASYKFIRDLSFPKRRDGVDDALYAISNPPNYPTAHHVRGLLRRARLTETELSVEHVEMLLNVLILDGKIEKLPALGTSLWDSMAVDESDSATEEPKKRKKKYRRNTLESDEDNGRSKLKKHKATDMEHGSSAEDELIKKKAKRKQRKKMPQDEDSNSSDAELESRKRKKRKKRKAETESDTLSETSDEAPTRKKRKKTKPSRSLDESSSEDEDDRRRPKSSRTRERSLSPFQSELYGDLDGGGGTVYRAIKEEHPSLGWSEAPCTLCPSFDFCKDKGPANPKECVYYGEWLNAGTLSAIEDQV